jgi:hypothetical protein
MNELNEVVIKNNINNTINIEPNCKTNMGIDNYMNTIILKCEKNMPIVITPVKFDEEKFIVPTINNYYELPMYKYNLPQLKMMAKKYKLKISGNKTQLLTRVYFHLYFSSYIRKIQKIYRGTLARKYKMYHGPAAINRNICTNYSDFVTMDPVKEINYHQFVSYKDIDGFIYGFDIISLHNLFLNSKDIESVKNPYNRNFIPESVIKNIKSIIKFSRMLNVHINLYYEEDNIIISNEKMVEFKALSLFQNIDALGNYSNSQWFLSLNRYNLIKFIRELADIWNYRAQITQETKRNICPPNGDPFRNLNINYINTEENMNNVRNVILAVLEKMVNSGVDTDSKALGACYILGSLTLVNDEAATSIPWLYQSFIH